MGVLFAITIHCLLTQNFDRANWFVIARDKKILGNSISGTVKISGRARHVVWRGGLSIMYMPCEAIYTSQLFTCFVKDPPRKMKHTKNFMFRSLFCRIVFLLFFGRGWLAGLMLEMLKEQHCWTDWQTKRAFFHRVLGTFLYSVI